jgi:hypothetical protein
MQTLRADVAALRGSGALGRSCKQESPGTPVAPAGQREAWFGLASIASSVRVGARDASSSARACGLACYPRLPRTALPGRFSGRRPGTGPYRLPTKQSLMRLLGRRGPPWPSRQAAFSTAYHALAPPGHPQPTSKPPSAPSTPLAGEPREALIYQSFPCAMDGALANQACKRLIQRE